MLTLVGGSAHEYGVSLGTQTVRQHLGERCGYSQCLAVVVDEMVGGFCPLQCDIRAAVFVEGDEAAVQFATLVVEHAHGYFYTCIAQFLYASSMHLGKGVDTSHHASLHTFLYNKVGAWRCLAVVRAWLKAYIYSGIAEQRLVLGAHRCKGIHFGMSLTTTAMIALANDAPVGRHYHSPHHRIGLGTHNAAASQLQAAAHVLFVGHVFFSLKKKGCYGVMLRCCDLLFGLCS